MAEKHGRRGGNDERRFQEKLPLVVNGWTLFVWSGFADRWRALRAAVEEIHRNNPAEAAQHPATKLLKMVRRLVLEQIPADPSSDQYRQGLTLGKQYRHWRRAKFLQRFRLFFRYHSESKVIVYVWLNDESSLRKAGDRADVYEAFKAMLAHDAPPSDWDELVAACKPWTKGDVA